MDSKRIHVREQKQEHKTYSKASAHAAPESTPESRSASAYFAPRARTAFAWVVGLCSLWVLAHSYLADSITVRLCNKADRGIPKEERMPVFLHTIAFDGYVWNHHAEHVGRDGSWRLRHTTLDNAPHGREVHWNSAFAWFLRGLGEAYRASTGESLRNSIYRMSIWANPILLVLAIVLFAPFTARRFGYLSGSVMALGMVGVMGFYEGFLPAYPDHHGQIAFTLLGLAFGIAWAGAGWVQKPEGTDVLLPRSLRQARQGMILSALSGAAGLWISAISAGFVMAALGAGMAGIALFFSWFPRTKPDADFYPGLWKTWTSWGVGGSLFFYVLEYFPGHLSWRLEVNHPLYAIAWLGGGWAIVVLMRWMRDSDRKREPFPWKPLIVPGILCALLPLAVLLGGGAVHSARDSFMIRLHTHISEFMPLLQVVRHTPMTMGKALGILPLLGVASMLLLPVKKAGRGARTLLILLCVPTASMVALQFYQLRWGLLAAPLYIALAALLIPQLWALVPRRPWFRVPAAGLLFLFGLFTTSAVRTDVREYWRQYRAGDDMAANRGQALALLHRQMARAIRDSAGDSPVVLLSSPNSSCLLGAMGGFRTLGTLYWENAEGLRSAAKGYHAQTDQEALAFLQEHGVTHIALMTWEHFIEPYFSLLHPDPPPGVSVENSFAKRLFFDKVIPPWSRPIIFPPNELTRALNQWVLLLQVVPDQRIEEAWLHAARFILHVEQKPEQAVQVYEQVLEAAPRSPTVRVELANVFFGLSRPAEAAEQILLALPDLEPDERGRLAEQAAERLRRDGETEWADRIREAVRL